jgi:histidinol dehydrogenase
MGAARYTGGLWVGSFLKTCTIQKVTPEGSAFLAPIAETMAKTEGLMAHALAARLRGQAE